MENFGFAEGSAYGPSPKSPTYTEIAPDQAGALISSQGEGGSPLGEEGGTLMPDNSDDHKDNKRKDLDQEGGDAVPLVQGTLSQNDRGRTARRSGLPADHLRHVAGMRSNHSVDFKAINQTALENLSAVLERVAPGGDYRRGEYAMLNPHRDDRHLGSFSVNIITGRWADFATGDRGGDIISLVAFLLDLRPIEAARNLARMLDLADEVAGHE